MNSETPKAEPSPLPMTDVEIAEFRKQHVACELSKPEGFKNRVRWCIGCSLLATIASRDEAKTWKDRAAENLADEADVLISRKLISERSPLADALLDFRADPGDGPGTLRSERIAALETDLASMALEAKNLHQHLKERTEQLAGEIVRAEKAEAERDSRDRMLDIAHNDRVKDSAHIEALTKQRDELRGVVEMREGTIQMAVDRLGGRVEGRPTHRGNFLQRIDELVRIEVDAFRKGAPLRLAGAAGEGKPPTPETERCAGVVRDYAEGHEYTRQCPEPLPCSLPELHLSTPETCPPSPVPGQREAPKTEEPDRPRKMTIELPFSPEDMRRGRRDE
jgi:hypothetical protein